MFFRPLGDLAERYNVLQSAMAAAGRIFEVLDHPTEFNSEIDGLHLDRVNDIAFEDVWFAYKENHWILKGLTLHVKQSESLAIVGMTGAGKTTIINILLRLYEFQKGSIKINGLDIRLYSLSSLRKQFSLVLQDPVIFSGTIAENLTLHDPTITTERLNAALDTVNIRAFIEQFPKKMHHQLSERGMNLSVGEMQLISMARAVAHNRPVFLFDEATANIDTKTEKMIQGALENILKHKTALVIAHRLSTIQNVSRIIVLHNGTIKETGSHQELLQANGLYEKLYRLQYV
jgi:ATP-binding cassette subfamily B protein